MSDKPEDQDQTLPPGPHAIAFVVDSPLNITIDNTGKMTIKCYQLVGVDQTLEMRLHFTDKATAHLVSGIHNCIKNGVITIEPGDPPPRPN